jgi:hypothetical protein
MHEMLPSMDVLIKNMDEMFQIMYALVKAAKKYCCAYTLLSKTVKKCL